MQIQTQQTVHQLAMLYPSCTARLEHLVSIENELDLSTWRISADLVCLYLNSLMWYLFLFCPLLSSHRVLSQFKHSEFVHTLCLWFIFIETRLQERLFHAFWDSEKGLVVWMIQPQQQRKWHFRGRHMRWGRQMEWLQQLVLLIWPKRKWISGTIYHI